MRRSIALAAASLVACSSATGSAPSAPDLAAPDAALDAPSQADAASAPDASGRAPVEAGADAAVATRADAAPSSSDAGTSDASAGSSTWSGAPLLVAVGYDGIRVVSEDGAHWMSAAAGGSEGDGKNLDDQYNYRRVAYGMDRFVAVGGGCLPPYTLCSIRLETMKSDRTWKVIYGPTDGNGYGWLGGVATDGHGLWVAVGGDGPTFVSHGGDTWTHLPANQGITLALRDVKYGLVAGKGRFVAVGDGGARAYSDDGSTWTVETKGTSSGVGLSSVAFGGGHFVAVGANGRVSVSSDGATWQEGTLGSSSINNLAYGAGGFVVADSGKAYAATDPTVFPWSSKPMTNAPSDVVHWSAFGSGSLYFGLSWTQALRTSADGVTWTTATVTTGSNSALGSIASSND